MGALIAIGSILTVLWAKHHATATQAVPATASGSPAGVKVTGAPDPTVAYDPNAPAQADAIGNTHLSTLDPIFTPGGDIVALPYRPADLAYGGGVQSAIGTESDNPLAGSVGSGIGAIEQVNAPHATTGLSTTPTKLPFTPLWARLLPISRSVRPSPGPTQRATPKSPLKPTHAVVRPSMGSVSGSGAPIYRAYLASSSPREGVAPAAAGTTAKPVARTNYLIAGRRLAVA